MKTRPLLALPDYQRIYQVIYSVLEASEVARTHRACILFTIAGTLILREHYKLVPGAQPLSAKRGPVGCAAGTTALCDVGARSVVLHGHGGPPPWPLAENPALRSRAKR